MIAVSIDPSTRSIGYCVWKDDENVEDGYLIPSRKSPIDCLDDVEALLWEISKRWGKIDAVACERMFVDRFQGVWGSVLNVMPLQIESWCTDAGTAFVAYPASRIKSEFGVSPRKKGSKKVNAKEVIYGAVQNIMSDASRDLPKKHLYDVSDAIAVGIVAQKYDFKTAAKK